MVNELEKENENYINRHKHVLEGFINNENENKEGIEGNEENIKFLQDSKGEYNIDEENDNEIEIDMKKLSIIYKTKNLLVKLFYCLMPFEKDIKFIKANYNTTVLLVFKIYRFLFLMSIFSAFIFLVLCVLHIIKGKNELGKVCKYGFPCFLFYSSYTQSESGNISIIYGVWLMFYFICNMIYYFLLSSEDNKQEIYYQNNNIYSGCSYLFSSWNFNNKNQKIIEKNKEAIKKELEIFAENSISQLDGKKENNCSFCCNFLAHILYIVFLGITFFIIIIFFFVREKMRNSNKIITKLEAKDIIADIITYLFIGLFLYLIVWLSGFFPKCEGWKQERLKYSSEAIKKLITSIISIVSLLFIITYFTLNANDKKIIPFLDINHVSFFGCPGKFEDHRHDLKLKNIINNYDKISSKSYSQCREEDVGITIFFIFIIYYSFIFLSELLDSIFSCFCLCMEKPTFRPSIYIINYCTTNLLYLLVIYYIPFFAILYPIIVLIIYKFHFFILKRRGSFSFKETGINHRNNKSFILNVFVIFNIAAFTIIGYFYFYPFTHSYTVECYTPKEVTDESFNILLYNTKNWCGPLKSKIQLSSILTNKMKNTPIIGWIVNLFQQLPFIIILFSIILIILIYRKYNPDKRFYDYIANRQKEIVNSFYILYEQISKRDILTSMLLKITQQKLK